MSDPDDLPELIPEDDEGLFPTPDDPNAEVDYCPVCGCPHPLPICQSTIRKDKQR